MATIGEILDLGVIEYPSVSGNTNSITLTIDDGCYNTDTQMEDTISVTFTQDSVDTLGSYDEISIVPDSDNIDVVLHELEEVVNVVLDDNQCKRI